jgi:hypothetical protein
MPKSNKKPASKHNKRDIDDTDDENSDEEVMYKERLVGDIKDMYIDDTSVPLSTDNPFPMDFDSMSFEELENVYYNARIHCAKKRKTLMVDRFFHTIENLSQIASARMNFPAMIGAVRKVSQDNILRESVAGLIIGKGLNPKPIYTVLLSAAMHATELYTDYLRHVNNESGSSQIAQKAAEQDGNIGTRTGQQTRGSDMGQHQASNANVDSGQVAERQDDKGSRGG